MNLLVYSTAYSIFTPTPSLKVRDFSFSCIFPFHWSLSGNLYYSSKYIKWLINQINTYEDQLPNENKRSKMHQSNCKSSGQEVFILFIFKLFIFHIPTIFLNSFVWSDRPLHSPCMSWFLVFLKFPVNEPLRLTKDC